MVGTKCYSPCNLPGLQGLPAAGKGIIEDLLDLDKEEAQLGLFSQLLN